MTTTTTMTLYSTPNETTKRGLTFFCRNDDPGRIKGDVTYHHLQFQRNRRSDVKETMRSQSNSFIFINDRVDGSICVQGV
jgi:hypothetical protein